MSFTEILNLSISASWLVLAVVVFRLLLKKAPKALHCALWALVAFRLLCPVSIESELSLIPSREVIPQSYLMLEPHDSEFTQPAILGIVTNPVYEDRVAIEIEPTVDRVQQWDLMGTILWTAGMGAMGIYALYSYLSLRLRVRMAAWKKENIWECDELDSPFILGLLRPRIYLPSDLDPATRENVLAHERAHLKRLDHIWKPLGFILLTVHWFNPVMWLAYCLLCRDIELACDEKVIQQLDRSAVRAYSESLVQCTIPHRSIALCPLAFGEVGVKGRIKAIVRYRKPSFWIIVTSIVICILLAVCFLTDPADRNTSIETLLNRDDCQILSFSEKTIKLEIRKDQLPENVLNGQTHRFDDDPIVLLEYDDTIFSITEARMSGDELLVTIAAVHNLSDDGAVLLPYHPFENSPESYVHMANWDAVDAASVYGSAVQLRENGRDFFSVAIKADVWNRARDYIQFQLEGLYSLTYRLGIFQETTANNEIETVHIYEAEGVPSFTAPQFQLHSDGTFSMIPNAFTSHHARGHYTLEDGTLEMRTEDNRIIYIFTEEHGEYIYDRDRSNDIEYYFDAMNYAPLPDGTRFVLTDRWQFAGEELDALITANLEKIYGSSAASDLINTVSYQILDFSCTSGTPLAGTLEPTSRLTLYVAAVYRSFQTNDGELIEESYTELNAAMTFQSTGHGIKLIGLLDTTGTKLEYIYSTTALDIWNFRKDSICEILAGRCLLQAEQHLMNPPDAEEIKLLIEKICNTPTSASNPGAYIKAHPEEYARLLELGQSTVSYSFKQFAEGNGMHLRGHIMALACREIIGLTEEVYEDGTYMTGQVWFNTFTANADKLFQAHGEANLRIWYPYHALALDALGMIQ